MSGLGTGLGISLASTTKVASSTAIEESEDADISAFLDVITSQDGLRIITQSEDILIVN